MGRTSGKSCRRYGVSPTGLIDFHTNLFWQNLPAGDVSLLHSGGEGTMHGVLRVVLRRQVPEGRLDDVPSSNLQANSRVSAVAAGRYEISGEKNFKAISPDPLVNV